MYSNFNHSGKPLIDNTINTLIEQRFYTVITKDVLYNSGLKIQLDKKDGLVDITKSTKA